MSVVFHDLTMADGNQPSRNQLVEEAELRVFGPENEEGEDDYQECEFGDCSTEIYRYHNWQIPQDERVILICRECYYNYVRRRRLEAGEIKLSDLECLACHGTGELFRHKSEIIDIGQREGPYQCSRCKGTGLEPANIEHGYLD